MKLGKCTQIVKLVCQLIADLQRGRTTTPNYLRVTCPFSLQVTYQLTDLDLELVYIVSLPVWAGINLDSISGLGWI